MSHSAFAEHSAKLACRESGCFSASPKAVRKPVMFAGSLLTGIVRSQTVQSMKRLSQTWNTSCKVVHLTMRGGLEFFMLNYTFGSSDEKGRRHCPPRSRRLSVV